MDAGRRPRTRWKRRTKPAGRGAGWPGSGCTSRTKRNFPRSPGSSSFTPWRSRTLSKLTNVRSSNGYGDTTFVVLKPARYVDETETVEFGEIHVFVGSDFVITVRHGKASALDGVRERLESEPDLLRRGSVAVLYAIMDEVVDDYAPVVEGLENDIDEIETEVFGGKPEVSRRIYQLSREVIQFQRATKPLTGSLSSLLEDERLDPELRRYLRDVQDHLLRVTEQINGFRELLSSVLSVNLTLAGINQSDQTKKISAWAAVLFAPTLIAGIYGMNFDYMPELHWLLGYPFALALMLFVALGLHFVFKKHGWL